MATEQGDASAKDGRPRAATPPAPDSTKTSCSTAVALPRVAITFCTQCHWMLRAAYFAQELLSTFDHGVLGEVALIPGRGGVFTVEVVTASAPAKNSPGASRPGDAEGHDGRATQVQAQPVHTVIWDRATEGGFPETKVLKRRVRDLVQPGRGLGHVDRGIESSDKTEAEHQTNVRVGEQKQRDETTQPGRQTKAECEDCK